MKNTFYFLIVIALFTGSCNYSKTGNIYKQKLKSAEKERKFILLDFTAVWCGGCKAYDQYVFDDSSIVEKLKDNFFILKIDRDNPENRFLVEQFKIYGLPHIVIIDASERIIGSILGFDSKLVDNPDLFVSDLEYIVKSQERIEMLESVYNTDTFNIDAINNLLTIYSRVGNYIGVDKLKSSLVNLDPTPERLFEYNFEEAIHSIDNEMDPGPILAVIGGDQELDAEKNWIAHSKLLHYYESINDIQSQDYYYQKLLTIDPDYYKKNYARFLFENNLKIDTAILLTNECLQIQGFENDHWGQFLKAHSLVYQGNPITAVKVYSEWMEDIKQRWENGETYWPLYFYARFANFHNIDLTRALNYLKISEEKRNMIGEKLLMAEILFKLGKVEESIEKLNETLDLTDNKRTHQKIIERISDFEKNMMPGS